MNRIYRMDPFPRNTAILSKTNFRHVTMAAVREDDFSGESATTTASG
jgi:hypothetical protein